MAYETTHQVGNPSSVRNITVLTIVFMVSLWGFFTYWAVTSRLETIVSAEQRLSQMAHAVDQYSTNLLNMVEIFHVTTERWLMANTIQDPRTDTRFIALIEEFRKRTGNLVDIRMASSNGDLYYFPNDPDRPKDNVADREYFKAVIDATPGLIHIGIPVVSRVSGQWRLPVTVRMKKPHHGLEVINASVNLNALVDAFESQRPRPNGAIGLWKTDGVLLVRAPQVDAVIGTPVAVNRAELDRIRTQSTGSFFSESGPIDSEARLISHKLISDFQLAAVVTDTLSDTLKAWRREVLWVFVALVLITLVGAIFSTRLVRALKAQENHTLELERLATTDSLTDTFNRRQFLIVGIQEFSRSQRYCSPMSLLMLDIDHFKNINDTWGHPTGDRVLQALAKVMSSTIRDQDRVGRLGGEEFAVILPETDLPGASVIAERIRGAVQKSTLTSSDDGNGISVTVSIGVATSSPDDASFDTVLSRADKRLYAAKEHGRNCVVLA